LKNQRNLWFDVVVAGGGTTGLATAMTAARVGARVLLLEQLPFLGGNATIIPGWLGFHALTGEQMVGGVPFEIVRRMQAEGTATAFERDPICGSVVGVDPNWWKVLSAELVEEEGISTRLHTRVCSAARTSTGLVLGTQCRGQAAKVSCRVLVDATDTGEVARMAGARFARGRASDHRVQVASWAFTVGNVNVRGLIDYLQSQPGDARPFPDADLREWRERLPEREVFVLGAFASLVKQAVADGLPLTRANVPGIALPRRGEFFTVASRVEDVDPGVPESLTRGELEGARQARHWLRFLREYVPGFRDCRLAATPHQIGLRETNHLAGEYTLTGEDLLAGREFADAVACGAYHLDIHSPDHAGLETARPPRYQIPYRSLLPKDLDHVLVAGRCISATHEAMASTRVIPISMALGQAAGTAAALACAGNVSPRDLPTDQLRAALLAQHAILG
jgi:hypothetical protein